MEHPSVLYMRDRHPLPRLVLQLALGAQQIRKVKRPPHGMLKDLLEEFTPKGLVASPLFPLNIWEEWQVVTNTDPGCVFDAESLPQ